MRVTAREDSGQSTVEFALVLPVVILFLMLIVQCGLVLRDRVLVTHAAREGARAAAVAETDREAAAQRAVERAGELNPDQTSETVEILDNGRAVRVQVTYRSRTDLPLIGALIPDIDLTEAVTMRLESMTQNGAK